MDLVPSAAPPSLLRAAKWRKSRHSNPSGNCVEMARLPGQRVAVRDSRRPDGPALLFSQAAWETFLRGLRESAGGLVRGAPPVAGAPGPGRAGDRPVCNGLQPSAAEMFPGSGYSAGPRGVGDFRGRTLTGEGT